MKPISIWQPREINGETVFIRPPVLPLGDHYADQIKITAKKPEGVIRVCYFGESAAAGYLYAPLVTPAKVLQHQLFSLSGNDKFEIIDLSRTNECLGTMLETIKASVQLKPDILVIFSGNNWTLLESPELSPYSESSESRKAFAKLYAEKGALGPVEFAARQILDRSMLVFSQIEAIATKNQCEVVLMVPEVNLNDWENIQPPFLLSGNDVNTWYTQFLKAKSCLQRGQNEEVIAIANKMLEASDWSDPTALRLLGKAFASSDPEKARTVYRAETEATDYPTMGFLAAPQANLRTQEIIRRTAKHFSFHLVDLPKIFEVYSGSPLPGRKLFLDYCHLTLEGMEVAMAGLSEKLFDISGNGKKSWKEILHQTSLPNVPKEQIALTKFAAAIHNAHRLLMIEDKQKILEYWCQSAIEADQSIKKTMEAYIRIRLSETPVTLSGEQAENYQSAHRLLTQHGLQYDYLDADLILVIEKLIGKKIVKSPLPERLDRHPSYRLWEPLYQLFPNLMQPPGERTHAYLKCYWPETGFCFYGNPEREVFISFVLRMPENHTGQIQFKISDETILEMAGPSKWIKVEFKIRGELMEEGLNKITIHWPTTVLGGEKTINQIINRLSEGREADLHPVFGEVFEIKI